ncbi:MAG: glycosyltransferase [Bacteroidales bacterium]|nr:glycosyltransferase [Bacteroidales bacterium]
MPERSLHIIAFDIPYPPNYGGVIDVFYKLAALHRAGVRIKLHCFEYPGRERAENLREYCEKVWYYPRLIGWRSAMYVKPYIVASRKSDELIRNLQQDDAPILFEGLHSCYYLDHPALAGRFKIYRESNIEHRYYFNLCKVDRNLFNKCYYLCASAKLLFYQKVIRHAQMILAVSDDDKKYFRRNFRDIRSEFLPSFHANDDVSVREGRGDYVLYHGNLEVPENEKAVRFLIKKVFSGMNIPFVIAGMKPRKSLLQLVLGHPNVRIIPDPGDQELFGLIRDAHANILVTFQSTGLKLKLLNALFNGRFCIANRSMLNGTGLEETCLVEETPAQIRQAVQSVFAASFTAGDIRIRRSALSRYSNPVNAEKLCRLIFDRD